MGTQYSTMKVLIFTSAMLALAASDSCSDCTAVVSHIAGRLSTPESLAAQGEILVGELCPGAPDPEACVSGLPGLWNQIAAILWPGYWDPTADWMCADICAAPEDTTMTCDGCNRGGDRADHLPGQPDRRVPRCCGRHHQTGTSYTCRRWFRWRLWTGLQRRCGRNLPRKETEALLRRKKNARISRVRQ